MRKPFIGIIVLTLISSLLASACAPSAQPAPPAAPTPAPAARTLTIYSGRAESLVKPIIDDFTKATGVKVQVRYGGTSEMAAAILEEGKNSPADVFFAQDPGGLGAVDSLLMPLPEATLNLVPARFRSPKGTWVGISGRARVVVYNTQKLKESDLPDDIWDFTDPKWKGRMGWAPTNASFQAMVTAMRSLWGEGKTEQWLKGMQSNNPKVYPNNTAQVNAVGDGEIDVAFPNHYYLYGIMQTKGESFPARNYYMRGGGPGSVILVAGAGVLQTTKNKETAQQFIEFMLSRVAQQYFASQTYEYPVVGGVTTHRLLKPIAEIKSPDIDIPQLADVKGTVNLLRKVGIIP